MSERFIKEIPGLLTPEECDRILGKRVKDSTVDGRLADFMMYRDEARGHWVEEFEMLEERLLPVIKNYSKDFFNLIPVEKIAISHIGFLNDEFGEFTEMHYDWELVKVKDRLIPKPFVFLLYLTDVVSGGELLFPLQERKIRPEKTKAVLFPCNYTYPHVAMPVTEGSKHVCRVTMMIDPKTYEVDELEI